MARLALIVFLCIVSASASAQNYFGYNIDKQKYMRQSDQLLFVKVFRKHRYCVRCLSGQRLNCDVPAGGEAGRLMCGAYGRAHCNRPGGGQVDYNGCP